MEQNDEVSTPSLNFPVGLALLLLLLLSVSAFFLCCLHWDKVRSLFLSSVEEGSPDDHILPDLDQKPTRPNMVRTHISQSVPLFSIKIKFKCCVLIGFIICTLFDRRKSKNSRRA